MKNRTRNTDHATKPPAHVQVAPTFRSPVTATAMANLLAEQRAAVDHHGQQAARARQEAEEQIRQITSREELIAEKEREIAGIRAEIERIQAAAQNANGVADQHSAAQEQAALAVQDLETVLGAYAPAALELPAPANGTPPGGVPAPGTPANGTPLPERQDDPGVRVAGTGPQQMPAHGQRGR